MLQIPRIVVPKDCKRIQLIAIGDASQEAYGAVVYIRTSDQHGSISVNVITAKARVAPLKTISLPRLELMAAWCAAKLVHYVQ